MKAPARSPWIWLALLCLYGFIHSASYALTNPVFESPDEPGHLAFVNRIASGEGLPNQYDPAQMMAEGHQNPLYYGAVGLALKAVGGPIRVNALPRKGSGAAPQFLHRQSPFPSPRDRVGFYAIRLFGSVLVAITVLQTGRAALIALPLGRGWIVAPMVVAGLPQLAFIGGSITNDGLVAFMGACALYAAAKAWREPESRSAWIHLGIWTGLAFLAKKNAICLAPAALLLLAAQCFDIRVRKRQLLRAALGGGFVALLIGSPVLLRNLLTYHELLGNRMELDTLQDLTYAQSLNSRHFRVIFPDIVPRSFVAHFGWMVVEVTPKYVWAVMRALLVGSAMSVLSFRSRLRAPLATYTWAACLLNLAGLVYYNLYFPQAQGRLLFPSVAAFALLCSLGVGECARWVSMPLKWSLLAAAGLAYAWFDWLALLTNQAFYIARP